jgi:hypothetical protein
MKSFFTRRQSYAFFDVMKNCSFFFLLMLLSVSFLGTTAQVVPGVAQVTVPTGGFHIEGNLQANTPTAGIGDWLPGPAGAGGNVLTAAGVPVNAATTFHLTDPYNTAENNFAGGKKYNDNPNIWTWVTNSALAKCDINNAMFHFSNSIVGGVVHTWLIVGADRRSNSGAAYIDFEFYQKTITANANGTFTSAGLNGGRTVGDLLLTLALTNGGGTAEFFVNRWQNTVGTSFDYIDRTAVTPSGAVLASTNSGTVPVSFPAFGLSSYSSNLFVEAAIDLTALFGAIDPCASLGVKTLLVKTKTSPSPTATIVDFITPKQVQLQLGLADAGPSQAQCGSAFSVTGTASPSPGDNISTTAWSVVSGTASIASPGSATSNITVTGSPAILRFTVNTVHGCTVSDTLILSVTPAPSVSSGSYGPFCIDAAAVTLGGSPSGGTWSGTGVSLIGSVYKFTPATAGAGTYTLTYSYTDPNTSCNGTATTSVTVNARPNAPTVTVVNNCDGSSDLTASNYTGSLLWSNSATTPGIHVTNAATYTVTQTLNGCTSSTGSGTSAPKTTPNAPTVTVVNNCDGSSDLTASNYTGSLLWSNSATSASIHVTNAATYTVTQTTANGCTSPSGSGTSAPKTTPNAPTVTVVNNCDGSSDLTASDYTGSLLWSNNATSASIHVTNAATYTVTQTIGNGCASPSGSGTSAPKTTPASPSLKITQPSLCGPSTGSIEVCNPNAAYTYTLVGGSGILATGQPVIFSNLTAGSNPGVTVTNTDGCTSAAADCNSAAATCDQSQTPAIQTSSRPAVISDNIIEKQTTVRTYPNPFSDKVKFVVSSSVAGMGNLEVYNIMGQKVKTVYTGFISAGSHTFELSLSTKLISNLVYVLRIGDKKMTGKLLQINQ